MSIEDIVYSSKLGRKTIKEQNEIIYTYLYKIASDLSKIQKLKRLLENRLKDLEKKNALRNTETVGKINNKEIFGFENGSFLSSDLSLDDDSSLYSEYSEQQTRLPAFKYCDKHSRGGGVKISSLQYPRQEFHNGDILTPQSYEIISSRLDRQKVVLNIGGEKHEVMWKLLERQPRSRLGLLASSSSAEQILNLCDAFSLEHNEYYFDRHPRTFNCILNFYRTGKLHVMDEICVMDFSQDLDYWMIDDIYLEACCEGKYSMRKEHIVSEVKKNTKVQKINDYFEDFGEGYCARYQECLWNLFENPNSSLPAKIISLVSVILVLLSTLAMCLNTMPEFKVKDHQSNKTIEDPTFALIEAICISWFTIEYLLRLAGSPDKWRFIKRPLNIVDVLAILPYYLSLSLMDDTEIVDMIKIRESSYRTGNWSVTTPNQDADSTEDEEPSKLDEMSRIILGTKSPSKSNEDF